MKISNYERIIIVLKAEQMYLKGEIKRKRYRFLIRAELDSISKEAPITS